jgi:hypothetical protein
MKREQKAAELLEGKKAVTHGTFCNRLAKETATYQGRMRFRVDDSMRRIFQRFLGITKRVLSTSVTKQTGDMV